MIKTRIAVVAGMLGLLAPAALAQHGGGDIIRAAGGLGAAVIALETSAAKDRIIFTNGRIVEGEILEETDTQVRMMVDVAGIRAEMTYQKADLLKVEYGEGEAEEVKGAVAADKPAANPVDRTGIRTEKVYVMELKGEFARDITQTPIADAVREAERLETDYLIVKVNNDWTNPQNRFEELPDDVLGQFDGFFRTKEIAPLLREDLRKWKNPPKLVMWVETAMGGAAFIPFLSDTIYFTPQGKMGGVGGIFVMFGNQGDRGVIEKQISLRLVTAKGFAIENGYDPRLIEAMTRIEYVLSYRMRGGKPEYFERMPENPGELLLTDNGLEDENKDSDIDRVRGRGNDWLTLDADLAQRLGVSKGTVSTLDDLLFELGLSRTAEVVGNADRIMEGWTLGVDRAERQLRELWQQQAGIAVGGDWDERRRARGQKINLLEQMKRLIRKYKESLGGGYPSEAQLETMIQQLKLEQLADKK
ncbi:MAG: hypothetical protein ACF8R7_01120 [Phycisphaerales bacterium JB039]